MKLFNKKSVIIVIILIMILIDQISKFIYIKTGVNTIDNPSSNNAQYIIIDILVIISIIRYMSSNNIFIKYRNKIALSLTLSGAIGNLLDRIRYQNIITFIKLGDALYINLAYIYILISWIALAAIFSKSTFDLLNEKKYKKEREYEEKNNNSKY